MSKLNPNEIPQGTIVLYINEKVSTYSFYKKSPRNMKLDNTLVHRKDRAQAFILLAEFAVQAYYPPRVPKKFLEKEWRRFFGKDHIPQRETARENVRGTIILPTNRETFVHELTGRELFIPALEKSFWRKENPSEALLFLARFAMDTYEHEDIFKENLGLGWDGRIDGTQTQ